MPSPTDITLRAQTVVTPYDVLAPGWVTMRGPAIAALGAGDPPSEGVIVELGDRVLTPGFIDLHVHGASGVQVNGADADTVELALQRMAADHVTHGTTGWVATTVSDSLDRLRATIAGIGRCVGRPDPSGARVLGAHLEGPWLSPNRAGAHEPHLLRTPNAADLHLLLDASPGVVRMVTLAPELPGAGELIAALVAAGVVASVGHTDADLATTVAAFDAGARHVTHLFNAMPALHHRRPGPVGAALTDDRVTVEVIADGVHLDPRVLGLVLRAAAGRVVAVTDAVTAGGRVVDAGSGRVVLADAPDTLAGSVLTMDRAVANLVGAGASLSDAVTAATATPARVIGEVDRGAFSEGAAADLVVLDNDLRCVATVVAGRVVFDPCGLLDAVR